MPNSDPATNARSLSVRQLAFVFFLGVIVCAVFFAFGFVVGKNQNISQGGPIAEQVAPRSEVPPTVNLPAQDSASPPNPPASASKPGSSGIVEQDLRGGEATSPATVPPSGQSATETTSQPENPPASSVPARSTEPHGIMVQVVASRTEAHARLLASELRERGFRAVVIARRGTGIYRVQVGPFTSREAAKRTAERLRHEGFKPFIR